MQKPKATSPQNKSEIFDRKLVRARRGRGQKMGMTPFLLERCAHDFCERILDINRTFKSALIIGDRFFADMITHKLAGKIESTVQLDHTNHKAQIIAPETALPFKDESFDLVISALTLHAVNQVPKAVGEMRRVLAADGLFIGALFGGQTLAELRKVFYAAEEITTGKISPRIAPFMDMTIAAGLLQNAGFAMPVLDRDVFKVSYTKLGTLYADLRRMGETNSLNTRLKTPSIKLLFDKIATLYKEEYALPNGKLPVSFEILWLTGWAPHPDQQKPLQPGSAKARLSDALGVKEHKL